MLNFFKHALDFCGKLIISVFSGFASKEKMGKNKSNITLSICKNNDSQINDISVESTNQQNEVSISENSKSIIRHVQVKK